MEVGPWAREKLGCLEKYLSAYTKILSKRRFKGYFYIDAFAGPGSLKIRKSTGDPTQASLLEVSEYSVLDKDESQYLSGSPRVALELRPPFTHYIFIEVDRTRVHHLETLKSEFEAPNRSIYIRQRDCNEYLTDFLKNIDSQRSQWRGVVFLDPFGMQVPWRTIKKIGETGIIEILINFPVGMAIQRLLKRHGQFSEKEREKLDSYFGTSEWFDLLYSTQAGLFGEQLTKQTDSGDVLVRWYRERLKAVFGHVSSAREVYSASGRPLYYLIFAGPNKTGAKIADYVLQQGARRIG